MQLAYCVMTTSLGSLFVASSASHWVQPPSESSCVFHVTRTSVFSEPKRCAASSSTQPCLYARSLHTSGSPTNPSLRLLKSTFGVGARELRQHR